MPQKYYLPEDDSSKADLLLHFRDTIPQYSTALELVDGSAAPKPELLAQAADAAFFDWLVKQCTAARGYSEGLTAAKNAVRDGTELPAGGVPATPAHVLPSAVTPGVVARFQALVRTIKAHKNYTQAIGIALHIEGEESAPPDLTEAQPDLTGAKVTGGEVRIPWKRGPYDAVYLEVDRGTGFSFLAVDTRPDYVDTTPLPAAGAVWKYRAMYMLNDQKVGQWSAVVPVRVG